MTTDVMQQVERAVDREAGVQAAEKRPAQVREELERLEPEIAEAESRVSGLLSESREVALAAWRGEEDARAREEEVEAEIQAATRELERLGRIRADLVSELSAAEIERELARWDAKREELEEACEEAETCAKAVERELSRLVGALGRWSKADTMRISLVGRLGMDAKSVRSSGLALKHFLAYRLGRYVDAESYRAWKKEFRERGFDGVDGDFTRVALRDAGRRRKRLERQLRASEK